jgi:hypothetical protein
MSDYTVKAVLGTEGEWDLDVLGCPYGGPVNGKDAQGEYFDAGTKFHEDKFGLPPAVYYHGFTGDGKPDSEPRFIGRTLKRWRDGAGEWFRVRLDKASAEAGRVWEAAKRGTARASSGAVSHLTRTAPDGRILHWPVAELSIFETDSGKKPANGYAVAMLAAKALWSDAGLDLPDIAEPEADAEGVEPSTQSTTGAKAITVTITDRSMIMSTEIEQAVAAALAARDAENARAAELADIARMKAELDSLKAEKVAGNRLPGGTMPYVTKFADTAKFDHLTPAEHAFLVEVAGDCVRRGHMKAQLSDGAIRGLALKMQSEAAKDESAAQGLKAFGLYGPGAQVKADELNRSTLASYGDEWVGVQYSTQLWEKIRAGTWVVANIPQSEIPRGNESAIIPIESVDPIWYKVAQAADNTSGRPDVTVTTSRVGTAQQSVTVGKMGCRVLFTGEMDEDSLIPWVPNAMRQIQTSGSEMMEYVCIDGDTETANTTSINDIGGNVYNGSASTLFLLTNGFRKLALVTNTANSRDGGAITAADVVETLMLMGRAGIGGSDPTKVGLICDPWTFRKIAQLPEVYTKDVYSNPTLERGVFNPLNVFNYTIRPSWFMHYAGVLHGTVTTATYMNKANAAGKVDQNTQTNNSLGALLAVRWDQWALKWKRRMTVESQRIPESDSTQIVALARWGLGYRDNEASAISYNLTVA